MVPQANFRMDFQFLAISVAQGSNENEKWADYEQLLRAGFFMFSWAIFFLIFKKNTVASAIKSCLISLLYQKI